MKNYVVEVGENCWLARWSGDPGRTLVFEDAKRYSKRGAAIAMGMVKKKYSWRTYKVKEIPG